MTDWYMISVLVFAGFLALLVWIDRKNVKRDSVLIMRKTRKGRDALIRIGTSLPNFWKVVGVIAVIIGFVVSAYAVFFIADSVITSVMAETPPASAFGLVLPSPTSEPVMVPGVVGVPFWYWIISIGLLVLFHEGMHGIMTARENLKIKSMGWGLLAIIPLAFVEPDEKALAKRPSWQQLRIFAAGSFGNFVLAGISVGILMLMIYAFYTPGGVAYNNYIPGYPAEQVNLTGIIRGIDGFEVRNITDLTTALDEIGPGQTINVETRIYYQNYSYEDKIYTLVTAEGDDGNAFIGISFGGMSPNFMELDSSLTAWSGQIVFIQGLFEWLFLINLGVGIVNLLPIGPLDGGRMWQLVFRKMSKKKGKAFASLFSKIVLVLLVLSMAIPVARNLLGM